ncbi:Iron deficiency-induced protein A [Candidatus Entotheonellaceae bacterium PAL068K]
MQRHTTRRYTATRVWVLLGLGWLILTGLPRESRAAATLTVYSGRGEQFTRPVLHAFSAQTGIRIRLQTATSAALLAKLREEGARSPADVFITNYVGVLEEARKYGLLTPCTSPMVSQVLPEFRGPDHAWLALSARLRVIVYNTDMIKPGAITSVLDLAAPQWRGKVATVTSGNQSFIGGLTALYALLGEAQTATFLRGLRANSQGLVMPKHTPIVKAVAAGLVPLGYVNHYYYYRYKTQHPQAPLGIVFPDQGADATGAVVTVAGAAILKASTHRDAAQRFMEFLMAPAGQKVFAEVNYEYPVNPQVPAHPAVVPRETVKLAPVNLALAYANRARAISLIETIGLD